MSIGPAGVMGYPAYSGGYCHIQEDEAIRAWYFAPESLITNRSGEPIRVGETLVTSASLSPVCCHYGYHASKHINDAMSFMSSIMSSTMLTRVELFGVVHITDDKMAATHRKTIAILDSWDILFQYACELAKEDLLRRLRDMPHSSSIAAFDYLEGLRTGAIVPDGSIGSSEQPWCVWDMTVANYVYRAVRSRSSGHMEFATTDLRYAILQGIDRAHPLGLKSVRCWSDLEGRLLKTMGVNEDETGRNREQAVGGSSADVEAAEPMPPI